MVFPTKYFPGGRQLCRAVIPVLWAICVALVLPATSPAAAEGRSEIVSFTVGEAQKSFDVLPEGGNYCYKAASSIRAHAAKGADECIYITFMSVDLKSLPLPATLPPPRDSSNPFAGLMQIGFGYIDAGGVEWAGPGTVTVQSFSADGVVSGTFDRVVLPHTGGERPDIVLSGGSFHVRLAR